MVSESGVVVKGDVDGDVVAGDHHQEYIMQSPTIQGEHVTVVMGPHH